MWTGVIVAPIVHSTRVVCFTSKIAHSKFDDCCMRGRPTHDFLFFVMKMLGSNLSHYDVPQRWSFLTGWAWFQWGPMGGVPSFGKPSDAEQVSVPASISFLFSFAHSIFLVVIFQSRINSLYLSIYFFPLFPFFICGFAAVHRHCFSSTCTARLYKRSDFDPLTSSARI